MHSPQDLQQQLRKAVAHFWNTRTSQGRRQGSDSSTKDAGARSMVTGGKQMDGLISLFASIVQDEGIPASAVHVNDTTLPGYFRPEKDWDMVVVLEGRLIASVEFKSHVGSFGNNFRLFRDSYG